MSAAQVLRQESPNFGTVAGLRCEEYPNGDISIFDGSNWHEAGRARVVTASPNLVEIRWADLRDAAKPLQLSTQPIVLVVPHPDDETLSTGGLLQCARDAKIPVIVVAVTDGEAAYGPSFAPAMRLRRPIEQKVALGQLRPDTPVVRLGLPDGRVAEFESSLAAAIDRLAPADALVVAPWIHDHHCDHEAVGRAASLAAATPRRRLLGSLFWAWDRTEPTQLRAERLSYLPLTRSQFSRRQAALLAHRTQVEGDATGSPVLTAAELGPMHWQKEFYVE